MTKKDGATERVQAISDVCHGLRHAEGDATVWLHLCSDAALLQGGPNMRQGGENGRRPGGGGGGGGEAAVGRRWPGAA